MILPPLQIYTACYVKINNHIIVKDNPTDCAPFMIITQFLISNVGISSTASINVRFRRSPDMKGKRVKNKIRTVFMSYAELFGRPGKSDGDQCGG